MMGFNQDATAQTHLTGDRLLLLDDVKWKWGEIPEMTPHTPSIRHKPSKLTQTPIAVAGAITDYLPDTGVAVMSRECTPGLASVPSADPAAELTAEQVVPSTLELADGESETGVAGPKTLVEINGIETSTAQSPGSSNIIDSQVTEPLPETKKSWFLVCSFCIFQNIILA